MTRQQRRIKLGGHSLSNDDLQLRYFAGGQGVETLRRASLPKATLSARQPLVHLIDEPNKRKK